MSANERKIPHYASEYQHWDLAAKVPLGYFEGCSTKYVARWRKKGGLDDLHKALHYLDKLLELYPMRIPVRNLNRSDIQYEVSRFSAINHLSIIEEEYTLILCNYRNEDDLRIARLVLEDIINLAHEPKSVEEPNRPGTPEDGGHHAVPEVQDK